MPSTEAFYAISRFVVKQLDVLSGGESSTAEAAIKKALSSADWPLGSLRSEEERTVNRPFVLEESLVADLEARAKERNCHPHALVDLALAEYLDASS